MTCWNVYKVPCIWLANLISKHVTMEMTLCMFNVHMLLSNCLREIYHPNLCKFIGATVKVPNIAIITEYGPKGSLNDVLQNDDIPLNWGFRFSFATDIARGLSHLHRHHLSHGMLKSSNCIIDDRWVVKITGLYMINLLEQACVVLWLHVVCGVHM